MAARPEVEHLHLNVDPQRLDRRVGDAEGIAHEHDLPAAAGRRADDDPLDLVPLVIGGRGSCPGGKSPDVAPREGIHDDADGASCVDRLGHAGEASPNPSDGGATPRPCWRSALGPEFFRDKHQCDAHCEVVTIGP